jgi:hypothetical protein
LARPGIRQPPLGELSVFGIVRKALEQAVALDAGGSFECFDDLPQPILNSRKLLRIFDIIRDERHYPLQVLDFDDDLSACRYADAQSREIGALSAAIVAYIGFSASPSGIGLNA